MKQLTVIRHAQADDAPGQADVDRPLSQHGHDQALRLGEWWKQAESMPDHWLASSARRVQETLADLASICVLEPAAVNVQDDFYLAAPSTLWDAVSLTPDSVSHLCLVGHNPGLSQLVGSLTRTFTGLGTGHLVSLELPVDAWTDVRASTAQLRVHWKP